MQGIVAAGSVRLVHNTRDFDLDPGAGAYDGLSVEYGTVNGNTFAGTTFAQIPFDGPFNKASVDIRRYFSKGGRKLTPQDKRVTLAFRLRAGISSGKLPFFEQFFIGGAESLRGYQEDRFWGDNMLMASAELRKPIAQSISGVLFADYGDAWAGNPSFFITQLPQSQTFQGNLGVGVGIRVNTPIGHLRLDYGVGSEGGRTHFSMGQAF
jgi:outer membrane protein insertion porin family